MNERDRIPVLMETVSEGDSRNQDKPMTPSRAGTRAIMQAGACGDERVQQGLCEEAEACRSEQVTHMSRGFQAQGTSLTLHPSGF